jgi:hypothetical protein
MVSPQKIMQKRSRREILRMGSAVSGIVASGSALRTSSLLAAQEPALALPWPWKEIEPASIQERAYQSTWAKNACMFGILEAVLGTLADKYGTPYSTFPVGAVLYGSGGFAGTESLCGAINGCGLLFGLFARKERDIFVLSKEIARWYETTSLPTYKPKTPKLDIPIVQSVAGSTLCSISSGAWAKVSGHKLMSMQHMERCSRLVADAAMQAVTLLNDYGTGKRL